MRYFTCLLPGVVGGLLTAAVLLYGSAWGDEPPKAPPEMKKAAEVKKVPAGKNVSLLIQGDKRSVQVETVVCLREGALEQLLTRKGAKEHEAILAADIDARDLHKALLLTGAEPGSPVQYQPKFKAPTGPTVKVSVQWEEKGKLRTEPAQKWVMNGTTKKELNSDWVFAGSRFVKNFDEGKPDYYLANDGDVICVANFESALLDLPFNSSKADAERSFVAFTERIPPKDTKVSLILEPVLDKKEPKAPEKKK
ncbi:MAG TPA: YdjY domain-containing protein [Gemmataceae bacterium]|nr:YdjY domain-containing protein [Gemmataceae bacterium]